MTPYRAYSRTTAPKQPRANPELALQIGVAKFLRLALLPGMLWSSTLNGAFLGPSQRSKMKASGMNPGPLDIVLVWRGWEGRSRWIELKAGANSLTPDQRDWIEAVGAEFCAVCYSIDDVKAALERWGAPMRPVDLSLHLIRL